MMKKENLSISMAKMIMVVVLIVGIGAVGGIIGYYLTKKPVLTLDEKIIKEDIEKQYLTWQNYEYSPWDFSMKIPPEYIKSEGIIEKNTVKIYITAFKKEDIEVSIMLNVSENDLAKLHIKETYEKNKYRDKKEIIQELNKYKLDDGETLDYSMVEKGDCVGFKQIKNFKNRYEETINLTSINNNDVRISIGIYYSYDFDRDEVDKIIETIQCSKLNELEIYRNEESNSEITDWKTYRNEEYGFELKYPKDYVKKNKEITNFALGALRENYDVYMTVFDTQIDYDENFGMGNFYIKIINNPDRSSLSEWFEKNDIPKFGTKDAILSSINDQKIIVDGVESIDRIISGGGGNIRSIIIPKDDRIITLNIDSSHSHPNYRDGSFEKNKLISGYERIDEFNQIINTFKFIKKDKIADWKTYRNEEYEFEFKYPEYLMTRVLKDDNRNLVHLCVTSEWLKESSRYSQNYDTNWEEECWGDFTSSIYLNDDELTVKEYFSKRIKFSDLRFNMVNTIDGINIYEIIEKQSDEYYEKFGELGSGLEYNYWFAEYQNYIITIGHGQDLRADISTKDMAFKIISTLKFIEK